MSILYVLSIADPKAVGPFHPDIINGVNSNWYNNLNDVLNNTAISAGGYTYSFIFADQSACDAWIVGNAITDPSDIIATQVWKDPGYGNVTYTHKFYTLPDVTGTGITNL